MVFSSHIFLIIFLPLCLLCYFLSPKQWRNGVLLLFSIIFYAFGAPTFVITLLATIAITFYLVKLMDYSSTQSKKKWLCAISIILNLGLLAYFKYANFFVENFNALLSISGHGAITWSKVLLPIGISFFSFQSITYVVDVYRGQYQPMRRLTDYMLYITMFPQLIAGPIVRYGDVAEQIHHRDYRWDECLHGFQRFVIGLCKKVLVADVLGRWVDVVLVGSFETIDSATAWIAIIAYTMQIYFDFSGYSDMAIGLGRILGFKFPENFDNPYNSASITEFWRRWHITLGTFMRNYLYIPLGGNRRGGVRTYFNLWIVFLLSGLWHGASWNFVLWGAYHGFWLVVERMGLSKFYHKIGRIPSVVITFIIVAIGFSLFRIENISDAMTFIGRLFAFDFCNVNISAELWAILIFAIICSFICLTSIGRRVQNRLYEMSNKLNVVIVLWVVALLAYFCCISSLTATDFSPFIYFRF